MEEFPHRSIITTAPFRSPGRIMYSVHSTGAWMRCLVAVKNFLLSVQYYVPHTLTTFHTCSIVDVPESTLDNLLIYQQSPLSCKSDSSPESLQ